MSLKWIHYGLILLGALLLAVGCAPAQNTLSTAGPALAPTADATISSSTSAPASGVTAGGDTIRLTLVPGKSQARYRVREQLASLSLPSDAIGSTSSVSGTVVGKTDGTLVPSDSKFVVDLQTLQSDRSQRDNFLRRNVLQTDQYPNATFVPTQVTGLPSTLPTSGNISFKLTGDLTVRNVTKPVTWNVTCQPQGNEGACHATTSFQFEYFDLTPPRVGPVLSIVDNITLEVDAVLQRVNS